MKLGLYCLLIVVAVSGHERRSPKHVPDDIHLQVNYVKRARSCLDYLQHGKFENGFYWLFDDQDKRYVAYCDLSSEPGAAWTLVMSWRIGYKNLPQFKSKAFMQDAPINHNTPNWNIYRQTLARMKSLRSRSTYWRATCSFDSSYLEYGKMHYSSYLRGKFSDFDIMTYVGHGKCLPVDYVGIGRHAAGSGSTAQFWQAPDTYILHIDRSHTGCEFKPNEGAVPGEDMFGFYQALNPRYSPCSPTQWWFGSYLAD